MIVGNTAMQSRNGISLTGNSILIEKTQFLNGNVNVAIDDVLNAVQGGLLYASTSDLKIYSSTFS